MAVTWRVSGRVRVSVDETMEAGDHVGRTEDLAGIEVEVFGSLLKSGGYATWGKASTGSDGTFSVSKSIDVFPEKPRNIRVKACFKGKKLEVSTGTLSDTFASDWYTVHQTGSQQDGPTINVGTKTFTNGGGTRDLNKRNAYRQAVVWYACSKVMAELERRDAWFAFKKKITVVYPANVVSGVPYANGVTRCAYIHSTNKNDRWWSLDTVLHEMMHLWNYDHNSGTSNWLQAICDGDTHAFQEKPAIAFHEGFAEYAKNALLFELWGAGRVEPRNRHSYRNSSNQALTSLSLVEGSDNGVINALHLLTTPDIYTRTFGTQTSTAPEGISAGTIAASGRCPASPDLTFWDVVKVFKPAPSAGWKTAWQVGNMSYGVLRFFDRAADVLPNFDDATKDLYLALLDPASTVEPQSRCR